MQFAISPTENEPKENSQEFSQVEAAAYQQRVDAIAVDPQGILCKRS
ncbi:MAG: hypothetical protein ACT4OT_06785 [Acidobacteriota bacterium]